MNAADGAGIISLLPEIGPMAKVERPAQELGQVLQPDHRVLDG